MTKYVRDPEITLPSTLIDEDEEVNGEIAKDEENIGNWSNRGVSILKHKIQLSKQEKTVWKLNATKFQFKYSSSQHLLKDFESWLINSYGRPEKTARGILFILMCFFVRV